MRRKIASLHDVMVHCQSVSMRELMVAETYEAKRGATSYGVHIAKVEVNTLTGEVRPLGSFQYRFKRKADAADL